MAPESSILETNLMYHVSAWLPFHFTLKLFVTHFISCLHSFWHIKTLNSLSRTCILSLLHRWGTILEDIDKKLLLPS